MILAGFLGVENWAEVIANAVLTGVVAVAVLMLVERGLQERLDKAAAARSAELQQSANYLQAIAALRQSVVSLHAQLWDMNDKYRTAWGDEAESAATRFRFALDAAHKDALYLDQLGIANEIAAAHNAFAPAVRTGVFTLELVSATERRLVEARRLANRRYRRDLGLYQRDENALPLDEAELDRRARESLIPPAGQDGDGAAP